MTLKCLLLDDELPGLAYLRTLCGQMDDVVVVRAYNDPEKLLKEKDQLDFNVCVLDIRMPGIDGLEVGRQLWGKAVIFTTAYSDYAAEAFDLEAVDYIRKPIQADRLSKAFQKARVFLLANAQRSAVAEFNSNKGKVKLRLADIAFIVVAESDRRDKRVRLKDRQELILKNISFAQLLELLPEKDFCQVNRSSIISLGTVASYSHDQILTHLTGDDGLPLAFTLNEAYRPAFRSKVTG
ncbi:two component transcriptional regulator, LytTR family [bacterium A37T11]|nr:two component transcriptional regulator, LytTR family [bacterium A37T11]